MVGPWEKCVKVRLSSWASSAGAVSRASLSVVRGESGIRGTSRDFSEGSVLTRKYSFLPGGDRTWVFPLAPDNSGSDTLSVHVKHKVTLFTPS